MFPLRYLFMLMWIALVVNADTMGQTDSSKRVIQSDHFSSKVEKVAHYSIQHIDKQKPIVLILKNKDSSTSLQKNPISVSISSGKSQSICQFTSYQNLCVLRDPQQSKLNITLQCQSTPCSISWIVFQPQTNHISPKDSNLIAHSLYSLEDSNRHVIARVICNDPDFKTFYSDVEVYASSHFQRGGSNKQIYIMFTNEEKGYAYFDIKQSSTACAEIKIENIPQKVQYSEKAIIDFTNKQSPSSIELNPPTKDFRIDCLFHELKQAKKSPQVKRASVKITLSGKNSGWQVLTEHLVEPMGTEEELSFSFTFKKPVESYESLKLDFTTQDNEMIILDFVVSENEIQEISLGQVSYFDLKSNQQIRYYLPPVPEADQSYIIDIFTSEPAKFILNKKDCSANKGCQFILTAKGDGQGYIETQRSFSPANEEEKKERHEKKIQFMPIGRFFKKKGKVEEKVYLKRQAIKGKSFRININTPHAIIYASSEQKCPLPDDQCSQGMGNIHHPIIYTATENSTVLITVMVLQNCEFAVTIVDQTDEYITLEDGAAFSYTLYEKQQKLQFKYTLKQKKEQVYFNLIAPLNTLILIVDNDEQQTSRVVSTEGFITFEPKDINSLQFTILVQKNAAMKNKQVHFTLIVSTSNTVIRLQSALAHYQTIKQQTYREYVFEFDPAEEYIINFYVHNIKEEKIKVMLALSIDRSWNSNNLDKIWVDREADYIDLNTFSEKLCKKEGLQTCEIFIRIENEMAMQVDITITLLTRNAFIELKDGIWQSYPESFMINEAHFYFYPKHPDKNVVILYHSEISNLKLSYNLWKTDSQSINPLQWPFPDEPMEYDLSTVKTTHQIIIDKEVLKQACWPYCVVLITLYTDINITDFRNIASKNMKIMASNNQIEIPEKTRIEMTLKSAEEREMIVDLKYALKKQQITFYNTRLFGNYIIFANLYSQKSNRCPLDGEEISDFILRSGENTFAVQTLQNKMKALKIENDTNINMCLSIKSQKSCKFALQYTTSSYNIKQVHLDSFEEVVLKGNETKYYQIQGYFRFNVKIMRKSGFPFIYIKKCSVAKLEECKEQLFDSKDPGKGILAKSEQFQEVPCQDCIYIFKFWSEKAAVVVLHLKSKYSMLELKEHQITTDFLQEEETGNYVLTHVLGRPLIVDIHVLEGDLEAQLTDSSSLTIKKQTSKDHKLLHFYVQPEANALDHFNSTGLGESLNSPFKFSKGFRNFVLVLSKKQANRSCIYSIVYSSGDSKIYLQDGLITDITLQPQIPTLFTYFKESQSHIYLTISTRKATDLHNLYVQSYYYDEPDDSDVRVQFKLDIPPLPHEEPNPTLLFLLPPKYHFEFALKNIGDNMFPVSIGINHQEIMFLPFDHEYPFSLHNGEDLNFLVENSQAGFIEVTIRKCDQSKPTFSYVQHYDNFVKGEFDNELILGEEPYFKQLVKADKAGVFYLNFKAQEQEPSMLSINLTFFHQKPNRTHLRPGGKGLLEYELLQSKKAQVNFIPIKCKASQCPNIKYFAMKATTLDGLYSHMVCPSTYYVAAREQGLFSLKEIKVTQGEEISDFMVDLDDHISFVGVKGVSDVGEEFYYRPIEVVTFWGQLSRLSHSHKFTLAGFLLVSICALLAFVRYNARKGYVRIQQETQ